MLNALLITGMCTLFSVSTITLLVASHSESLNSPWFSSLLLSSPKSAVSLKAAKLKQSLKYLIQVLWSFSIMTYPHNTSYRCSLPTCAWECRKFPVQVVIFFMSNLQVQLIPGFTCCSQVAPCMGKGPRRIVSASTSSKSPTPSPKACQNWNTTWNGHFISKLILIYTTHFTQQALFPKLL